MVLLFAARSILEGTPVLKRVDGAETLQTATLSAGAGQ